MSHTHEPQACWVIDDAPDSTQPITGQLEFCSEYAICSCGLQTGLVGFGESLAVFNEAVASTRGTAP